MDTGGLLQGLGLMVCIGAVLLVVLIAVAARAMSRGRNTPAQQNPTVWNTQGDERPRYDQPDIQTQGGFGGVPATGDPRTVLDRDYDRDLSPMVDDDTPSSGADSGDRLVDYNRNRDRDRDFDRDDDNTPRGAGGFGAPGGSEPRRSNQPRRERKDDDDVRSSGGFGGG